MAFYWITPERVDRFLWLASALSQPSLTDVVQVSVICAIKTKIPDVT